MSTVKLRDHRNAVEFIRDGEALGVVPAFNIQVENVPGFLGRVGEEPKWYGVYFEVPFEGGDLWVVEQGWERSKPDRKLVRVQQFKDWANRDIYDPDPRSRLCPWKEIHFRDWDAFIVAYDKKVAAHE